MNPPPTWQSFFRRPAGARPLIMAHRGASDDLPENTLASFARALVQGADVLETDIRFTGDDEIILMHDATVERTTNGRGRVADLTLSEIKRLRARRPHDSPSSPQAETLTDTRGTEGEFFTGGQETGPSRVDSSEVEVPTLAEFLEFSKQTPNGHPVPLALELKDDRFIEPSGAEQLVRLLEQHHALERVVLLSFRGERIRACKRIAPRVPIGMITLKNPLPLYETELLGPFFPLLYLNPLYFAWARHRGKIACPLDPAPEPRLGYYRRLGVPVLLTNHPGVTLNAVQSVWGARA